MLTLGSLFDGIGGFPLAGIHNGITPLWASEIEAFPIEVTKIRFPAMRHVGDITQLKGADLPPVDIVTGGSPCQDLSVAGQRAGLAGERSGLFMEQIRLVREMRHADKRRGRAAHAVRPRYMVWENVPGAFSSADGEDFRAVLEETCRIADSTVSIPRPPSGRWESSGAIMGPEFSVAWRVLDAQYWGVAQRRRRIFLVADFAGHSASKVLFEQDRLLGNPAPGGGPWQGAPAAAPAGIGDPGGTDGDLKAEVKKTVAFAANQRDELRDLHDVAGALGAQPGMKQQTFVAIPVNTQIATRHHALGEGTGFGVGEDGDPAYTLQEAHSHGVFVGNCLNPWDTSAHSTSAEVLKQALPAMRLAGGTSPPACPPALRGGFKKMTAGFSAGAAPTAGGIGYQEETAPTLKAGESGTNMVPSILCLNDQGGQCMSVSHDISGTLRAQMHHHQPLVMATQQGGAEIGEGICPTISSAAGTSGNNQPVLFENHGIDSRYTGPHQVAPTMSARYGTGGNNVPLVTDPEDDSYCIAGNIIDREAHNGGNGFGYQQRISYTLNTADRHAVFSQQRSDEYAENEVVCTQAARQYKDATDLVCEVAGLDCRNGNENGDLCGTLQSKTNGGYSLNNVHPVRTGNLIRRLTPLECERLQGFEDGWTDIPGASDSARYKALGNSVAIPCVDFVLRGIAYFLKL